MMLFDGQTADGNGESTQWNGGQGTFWVRFTSGSGDVKLQHAPVKQDGTEYAWEDTGTETTFVGVDGSANFTLGGGFRVRAVLANGASTPIVDCGIKRILTA